MYAAEASLLDGYYAATNTAKELIRRNMVDEGFGMWEGALHAVEPYVSTTQLIALKQEFDDWYQSIRNDDGPDENTGVDSTEYQNEADNTSSYHGNDNADDDSLAISEFWAEEHRKLAKRHTTAPYMQTQTRTLPGRSSTMSVLGHTRTERTTRPDFRNDNGQFHASRSSIRVDEVPSDNDNNGEEREKQRPRERMRLLSGLASGGTPRAAKSRVKPRPTSPCSQSYDPFVLQTPIEGVTGSSTHADSPTAPIGLMGSKENDDWFKSVRSITHTFVYGNNKEYWPNQPVKVAILDSGFAVTGKPRKDMRSYLDRIQAHSTFTNEFPNPETLLEKEEKQKVLGDLTGHGTTVAYQLMKTCPSAHVYIAKVTVTESEDRKAVPDKEAVYKAIEHAAKPVNDGGWGVDIINMSFGWADAELPRTVATGQGVSGAIKYAEEQGVLIFAAASNYGLTQLNDVFYPARDSRVISVDAEDGLGNPAPFARSSHRWGGRVRYCAPGLSIDSPVSAEPMCGSSFACPVAAGVAALVLEFSRHKELSLSKSDTVRTALSDPRGMIKVFESMSQQTPTYPGFRMLYPWHFLGRGEREEVASDIVRQLEVEFGHGNVGREIIRTTTWKVVQKTIA